MITQEEKFITIKGNKIRYLESGHLEKNTIVLIHGLGASAERWENVIPLFAKHFHVVIPDLIGYGYSDKPFADYTLAFFLDFLSDFLQKLKINKPIIIGSSLGGMVATEYAATTASSNLSTANDSIKKLVLVSPAGVMKNSTPALDAYIMAAMYPNEQSANNAFEMMSGKNHSNSTNDNNDDTSSNVDPKIIDRFVEHMLLPNAKLAFMSTLLGIKNANDITTRMQQITVPTLIIWGNEDQVIPVEHADSFVSSISNCKFQLMRNCGHIPYVEEPRKFFKIVMDFLDDD